MQRPIVGFDVDAEGDPIALLGCGHPQHVRHRPPFINRPWVATEEGRRAMLGQPLNCVRCERFELPAHFVAYKRTPELTESTVPAGLRRDHTTKEGVWAKIVVLEGRLRYVVESLGTDVELDAERPGIVVPEVPHRVEPLGQVRFFVEFYRAPAA
ncbi:MAG TPA: DUF3565 domain-containing protein [Gammaproteobacteria bacterium]|nr:DUF3565 domain-containing protein [Gammaproteobacteria bacterium]